MTTTKTVYVGLSGGVDSAVAAYLLKEQGYKVVGAFIKGWEPDFLPCTGTEDRLSAMRVAAHLGIPFVTYDLSEEYKQSVVDYFIEEYKAGRTPNPDVVCNRTIKFGAFWNRAKADGADFIATGHYALTNGEYLLRSKDRDKDQAYFLWTLTKEDLKHTLLPIGKYKKAEVRKIAAKAKLPNAKRRDSQGLCFLGHVDMHDFLMRYLPTKAGDVIDVDGAKVGVHDGAWFYTLGQHVPTHTPERLYVVDKDIEANTLTVHTTLQNEGKSELKLGSVSWVGGVAPEGRVSAEIRYHGEPLRAELRGNLLSFEQPVLVAPGQSVVLYDQTHMICLGGGVLA